mmetsp:Transcript_78032/g.122904  ORF Transcript_78032/g.122904 Transcript_78032/m.122904 type:complete len:416 (-) Transcript_78032:688-1935(-)
MKAMAPTTQLHQAIHEHKMIVGLRMRHGRVLPIILGVHVSTHLQQQHRGFHIATGGCHMNGCSLLVILDVHIGAPLHQPAHAVHVVVGRRHVQRRAALGVRRVHLDAVGVEEFHQVVALVLRDDVEGRLALLRLGRQMGAAAVAELGQAHVARVAGVLQQGLFRLDVPRINLRGFQQTLQHVHQHRAVPGDDLLQVEGLQLFPLRFEGRLQVREGIRGGGLRAHLLGAHLGLLRRRVHRRLASALPALGLARLRLGEPRVLGHFQGGGEGQVGRHRAVLHEACIDSSISTQEQDLHQGVFHLPQGDLIHHKEGDVVGTRIFHLWMRSVLQEAPQGSHNLCHELHTTGWQLAGPLHGLLHLRQQLLRHRRRSSRHQALVALKVQEVQGHQLLGVLPLHHSGHEISHRTKGEQVLGQ